MYRLLFMFILCFFICFLGGMGGGEMGFCSAVDQKWLMVMMVMPVVVVVVVVLWWWWWLSYSLYVYCSIVYVCVIALFPFFFVFVVFHI